MNNTMTDPYFEQYKRMERWFQKLERIENGIENEEFSSTEYKDSYVVFFLNCYHLHDYLEEDPNANVTESQVDSFIAANNCMELCGDICNAEKHLNLNSSGITGEHPEIDDGALIEVNPSGGNNNLTASLEIHLDNGTTMDAYQLAKDCIDAWKNFFQTHNLMQNN